MMQCRRTLAVAQVRPGGCAIIMSHSQLSTRHTLLVDVTHFVLEGLPNVEKRGGTLWCANAGTSNRANPSGDHGREYSSGRPPRQQTLDREYREYREYRQDRQDREDREDRQDRGRVQVVQEVERRPQSHQPGVKAKRRSVSRSGGRAKATTTAGGSKGRAAAAARTTAGRTTADRTTAGRTTAGRTTAGRTTAGGPEPAADLDSPGDAYEDGDIAEVCGEARALLRDVQHMCSEIQKRLQGRKLAADVPGDIAERVDRGCTLFSRINSVSSGRNGDKDDDDDNDNDDEDGSGAERAWLSHRLVNALRIMYYLEQVNSAAAVASRLIAAGIDARDTREVSEEDIAAGLAPFCKMDLMEEGTNEFQRYLLYLLNTLQHRGYRRYGLDCYQELFTPEGYRTYAWAPVYPIKDFVYHASRKETNWNQWLNMTHAKGNAASAADYLACCRDVQFPVLVKDRNLYAFRNGVYDTREDAFYAYELGGIPSDTVACKFFDLIFPADDDPADWYDIETPHLQGILDYQQFPEDVCRWMYIMIGRLLYEVNDLDRWQVIPYLKGQASSGKSTILLRVCANLYDRSDVGILSNNIEKKFGLAAFSDKYIFVAPEIKSDLQMEQAEFQSMVSGEDMSISVKYQTARPVVWKVPGIMAGNEVPGWADNSGSITRRIVLFDFQHKVDNGDMDLGRKLEAEMAAIIKKCNQAYRWAVRMYAHANVWRHLPQYFHSTSDELKEDTNVLEHFLKSSVLKLGSSLYMPWNEFVEIFQTHLRQHNVRDTQKYTRRDFYAPVFLRHALQKTPSEERRIYRNRMVKRTWLLGADVTGDLDDDEFV